MGRTPSPEMGFNVPQQQQQQPAAASRSLVDMRQAYLDALANPGPVQMPSAAGPKPGQAPTGTPQPNVMQGFLANNQGATGAGGYSTVGTINTLRGMQQPTTGTT